MESAEAAAALILLVRSFDDSEVNDLPGPHARVAVSEKPAPSLIVCDLRALASALSVR